MKKLLGCLVMVVMWFSACEGPMGPMGPAGRDANMKVCDFEVLSEHWIPVHDDMMGNIFEYEFRIPELTGYVFDEGGVVCYLVQYLNIGGKNTPVQTPLPYTFFGEYDGFLYSENYTYEIRPGYINFIVKVSDFDTEFQKPLPCTFRVVLMWK